MDHLADQKTSEIGAMTPEDVQDLRNTLDRFEVPKAAQDTIISLATAKGVTEENLLYVTHQLKIPSDNSQKRSRDEYKAEPMDTGRQWVRAAAIATQRVATGSIDDPINLNDLDRDSKNSNSISHLQQDQVHSFARKLGAKNNRIQRDKYGDGLSTDRMTNYNNVEDALEGGGLMWAENTNPARGDHKETDLGYSSDVFSDKYSKLRLCIPLCFWEDSMIVLW